jgi:butyrate kinase
VACRILVINLGSTSSKIGVFDEGKEIFIDTLRHSVEEIQAFKNIEDQDEWRKNLILDALKKHRIESDSIDIIACRGGLLPPGANGVLEHGAYEINDDMLYELKYHPLNAHPTNQAAGISDSLAKDWGIRAFIYDPPTVDEMIPIVKITGHPDFERRGMGHPLNMRSAALKYADSVNKPYEELTLIVTHLGGGISNSLHHRGVMIDVIHDEEGSFTPERAGYLPGFQLMEYLTKEKRELKDVKKLFQGGSGLKLHLGTHDAQEVEKRIEEGDKHAELIYNAMALNIAKNIAKLAVTVSGAVDQIILTGGLAHSRMLTDWIKGYIGFVSPVSIIPGENEMQALAEGVLRAFKGEESLKVYIKKPE